MSLTKMTADLNIIQALADKPNVSDGLSAQQLKAKFDESGNTIQTYINSTLTEEIDTALVTDPTLSIEGKAADAKATGDIVRNLTEANAEYTGYSFVSGAITSTGGTNTTSTNRIRTVGASCPTPENGDIIYVSPEYEVIVAAYSGETAAQANFYAWVVEFGNWTNGLIPIPQSVAGKIIMMSIRKVGHEDENISADIPNIGNYVHYYRKPTIPIVDPTLSISEAAADAKVTGDSISWLRENATESVSRAYLTPTIDLSSIGLTRKAENGKLVIYGTANATRRFLCLNGQNYDATTTSAFRQTLPAGKYEIELKATGSYPDNARLVATYTTFSAQIFAIFPNIPLNIEFTAPVSIGLFIGSAQNFGTSDNPSVFEFVINERTAKDAVARADIDNNLMRLYVGDLPATSVMDLPDNVYFQARGDALQPILGDGFTWTLTASTRYMLKKYKLSSTIRRYELMFIGATSGWAGYTTSESTQVTWSA